MGTYGTHVFALWVWQGTVATVRPRDTRPQAARTLQVHIFE